ncbi:MAG: peptide chain release factor N(5)-glutamine methyltransferase [Clostridia bacterium]
MAKTKIGGQAVMEGVMMRAPSGAVALAVRSHSGEILLETSRTCARKGVRKIPFIRGIFNLVDSLKDGMSYLMKSATIWGEGDDEAETVTKGEMKFATIIGVVFGLLFAVLLFIFLPDVVTRLLFNTFGGQIVGGSFSKVWASLFSNTLIESSAGMLLLANFIKGGIKVTLFIGYLTLVAKMKEIKRVFMYHGAEHKTINCFESEMPLTVENVQKCSTYHDRCGTAFLFFVILVSIFVMSIVEILIRDFTLLIKPEAFKTFVRILIRVLCLVPIASISYELLMYNGRHDYAILKPLKWLGRSMQRLSTRQPADDMVEVAIEAFNAAYAMDCDPSMSCVQFVKTDDFKNETVKKLKENGIDDDAAAEWIMADVLKCKRSEISAMGYLSINAQKKCEEMTKRLINGEPLQYILGTQQFFEFEYIVTQATLIPRFETELLTEKILKYIQTENTQNNQTINEQNQNDVNQKLKLLDLCCGSGCIGLTIALKSDIDVTLSDISEEAIDVCGQNAKKYKANVNIIKSDMFSQISGKFDIIVSNPPYIPTEDIEKLEKNVKFEPKMALDGGVDGLDFYKIIAKESKNYLNNGGKLFIEVGIKQAQSVSELLTTQGYKTEIKQDLNGVERMIIATI